MCIHNMSVRIDTCRGIDKECVSERLRINPNPNVYDLAGRSPMWCQSRAGVCLYAGVRCASGMCVVVCYV